ncbi:MAG: hypothetical protein GC155_06295 [Alphaproteobacteria bacterium]|nr:hypothetical protein [Alphaproteobacteria bacterium]
MKRVFVFLAAALMLALPACSTVGNLTQGLPSVNDNGASPRKTTIQAANQAIAVMDDLTIAANAGALPHNFLDDIVQFAPDVETRVSAYLDNTAACVVIDGSLQTDPAVGIPCSQSAFRRAFDDVSGLLLQATKLVDPKTDEGRAVVLAAIVLQTQLRPAAGGVWDGYSKDPDITLDVFNGMRSSLKASKDRLVEAATAALATKP